MPGTYEKGKFDIAGFAVGVVDQNKILNKKKIKIVQINKPDYYNDLNKVYIKIWDLLKIGLQNRDLPFHIPINKPPPIPKKPAKKPTGNALPKSFGEDPPN